ncbi:MAG TPA: hypothetical protein VF408_01545 [Sediminibacterium sp.]
MKPVLTSFVCLIFFCLAGHGQYGIGRDGKVYDVNGKVIPTDTAVKKMLRSNLTGTLTGAMVARDTVFPKKLPYNGMPNAIQYAPLTPVYKGNNGKGFDIYGSRVDNMPMLIPDSTNRGGMPNAFKPAPGNTGAIRIMPRAESIPGPNSSIKPK